MYYEGQLTGRRRARPRRSILRPPGDYNQMSSPKRADENKNEKYSLNITLADLVVRKRCPLFP